MTGRNVRKPRPGRQPRRLAARLRLGGSALGLCFLVNLGAACSVDPEHFSLTRSQIDERTPFVPVPAGQAWVNARDIRSVLQRNLGNETEQKIGLANNTSVPGDNVIQLRTRAGLANLGRLRFEDVVARFGGLPTPFTGLGSGDLMQDSDEIGSYFWAGQTIGEGTNCILGLRRVDGGMRQLPGGAGIMDIIVRNCVNGTQQDALEPLLASSIAITPVMVDAKGESRMLSPLAAPSGNVRPATTTGAQP